MNHSITLEQAIKMTTTYRENKEKIILPDYHGKNILPISETFERAAFDKLLSQPGCERLRIYYSMDEELNIHAMIVGVNANNEDMLPKASVSGANTMNSTEVSSESTITEEGEEDDENEIIEVGYRCPTDCPPSSELNP